MGVKPILFNTQMVQAILDGRKTETRRVVKAGQLRVLDSPYRKENPGNPTDKELLEKLLTPPYQPGDILYVRETWAPMHPDDTSNDVAAYMYKADDWEGAEEYDRHYPNGKEFTWEGRWRPSIHMPKEAARIFLRVTDVRVERLKELTIDGALKEGANIMEGFKDFKKIWDGTIELKDRGLYGWDANPWVFVVSFERIDK